MVMKWSGAGKRGACRYLIEIPLLRRTPRPAPVNIADRTDRHELPKKSALPASRSGARRRGIKPPLAQFKEKGRH
jgi:hypothetical protein